MSRIGRPYHRPLQWLLHLESRREALAKFVEAVRGAVSPALKLFGL